MKQFRCLSFIPVLLAVACILTPAYSATITTYSTLADWQAIVSDSQLIDFEGLAPAGGNTGYPSGLTVNGVEFIGLSGTTFGVWDTNNNSAFNFGSNEAAYAFATSPDVQITLPAGVTAFGIDLFSAVAPVTYKVSFLGNQYTVPTYSKPTRAFFGAKSDTAISTVELTLQGSNPNYYSFFDNFRFDVPEANTYLLIGSGLVGLALLKRRMNRRARHDPPSAG